MICITNQTQRVSPQLTATEGLKPWLDLVSFCIFSFWDNIKLVSFSCTKAGSEQFHFGINNQLRVILYIFIRSIYVTIQSKFSQFTKAKKAKIWSEILIDKGYHIKAEAMYQLSSEPALCVYVTYFFSSLNPNHLFKIKENQTFYSKSTI